MESRSIARPCQAQPTCATECGRHSNSHVRLHRSFGRTLREVQSQIAHVEEVLKHKHSVHSAEGCRGHNPEHLLVEQLSHLWKVNPQLRKRKVEPVLLHALFKIILLRTSPPYQVVS